MSMSMVCDEMGAKVRKFWGRAKANGNNEGLALNYCEELCQLCWSNLAGWWYQGHISFLLKFLEQNIA